MNTFRVDQTDQNRIPCGMNSIKYIGDSFRTAQKIYNAIPAGVDEWNQPKPHTFVILSKWDGTEYRAISTKEKKQ